MSSAAIDLPRNTPPSLVDKFAKMQNIIANNREAIREEGIILGRTVTAGVTGGVLGYVKGRYDRTEVQGVPIAAASAVVAKVGGYMMGRRDQFATFAHAAGDAAGAIAVYEFATEFGAEQKAKAKKSPEAAKTSGFFGRR